MFDEKRVFAAGPAPGPVTVRGVQARRAHLRGYLDRRTSPIWLAEAGAEILLVPNGSPFEAGKEDLRLELAAARVNETGLPLVYLNQVGGQDELVFDGACFVLNADGSSRWRCPSWNEHVAITEWRRDVDGKWMCAPGEQVRGTRTAPARSITP